MTYAGFSGPPRIAAIEARFNIQRPAPRSAPTTAASTAFDEILASKTKDTDAPPPSDKITVGDDQTVSGEYQPAPAADAERLGLPLVADPAIGDPAGSVPIATSPSGPAVQDADSNRILSPPASPPLVPPPASPNRPAPGPTSGANEAAVADLQALATRYPHPIFDTIAPTVGINHRWGGSHPDQGFDPSGFVQHVFAELDVAMPRWSRQQSQEGTPVPDLARAAPGDLLAFGQPVDHVGVYVGDGQMIHASAEAGQVVVSPVTQPVTAIRRLLTPSPAPTPPTPAAEPATSPVPPTGVDGPPAAPATPAAENQGSAAEASGVPWKILRDAERQYATLFHEAGQRWNVDGALLAAVAQTESAFNPGAVSPVGAGGLMQFMPATAAEMGVDRWDPASAIDGAARYLRISLDKFDNVEHAVASYNAGRGAVSRHGGIPPYRETQNYVTKVLQAWRARQ